MPKDWTFLTNHAHGLLAIARDPERRLRDIADLVGITERTAADIFDAGADVITTGNHVYRHRDAYEFLDSPGEWYLDPATGARAHTDDGEFALEGDERLRDERCTAERAPAGLDWRPGDLSSRSR
jgi:hypothetical protein